MLLHCAIKGIPHQKEFANELYIGLKLVCTSFSMLIYKCKISVEDIFIAIERNRRGQSCQVNGWAVKLCLGTFHPDFNWEKSGGLLSHSVLRSLETVSI